VGEEQKGRFELLGVVGKVGDIALRKSEENQGRFPYFPRN
jgi:hypothetical protein